MSEIMVLAAALLVIAAGILTIRTQNRLDRHLDRRIAAVKAEIAEIHARRERMRTGRGGLGDDL